MKSKKSRRESTSEDESEDSDVSQKSDSSSSSESDESSGQRHKRKKKHGDSSDSDSDSDNKRSKKRKHKKKKKKHGKKRRHDVDESVSELSSDGEVSSKKKKHKRKRRHASPGSVQEFPEEEPVHRVHSVVKDCRESLDEVSPPRRTYYQKEYHKLDSRDHYGNSRELEVQRFYRGSSKDRQHSQAEHYHERHHERNQRYEEYVKEEYRPRPRDDEYPPRDDRSAPIKGYRPSEYQERDPRRREFEEKHREFRERRGPPHHQEQERYPPREYPVKKERFRDDAYPPERAREREYRRERMPPNMERPPPPKRQYSPSPEEVRDRPEPRERYREPRVAREPKMEREPRVERDSHLEREPRMERDSRPERNSRPERDSRPERERPERESRPDRGRSHGARPNNRDRKSRFNDDEGKDFQWGKTEVKKEGVDPSEKEKPNFGLSGKLTADANTVNGVVIKYTEPDDAKQPKRRWRFYPFKGDKALPILYIHRQSAFLLGRDKKVVDIMLEHPSVSKQHAALQYRATPFTRPDGSTGRRVRPYVIDLDSANGTFVNNKKIEPRRYVELMERDVVKFGFSAREYVLLHENSKDDAQDDDNQEIAPVVGNVVLTEQIKQEKRAKEAAVEDG